MKVVAIIVAPVKLAELNFDLTRVDRSCARWADTFASLCCLDSAPTLAAGGTSGQVQHNNAGALGGFTMNGDAILNTGTGALTLATAQPAVHTWGLAQTFTVAAYRTRFDWGDVKQHRTGSPEFSARYSGKA
jgi:hypothetical protein